ncbi:hypothetical protein HNR46_001965 [Haloferula luteola]|uniref:Ice-binding protein C-terminal domain-containing protein n=1 Tax=Haloferula luteola TaxID=595692 RepID=A0A840V3U7_9BACT|nr:PEP-CTERM sorting domain-containing protein [Haloferula luteola]MBB5351726.1 hypothetical protein [Haloferula luteola]
MKTKAALLGLVGALVLPAGAFSLDFASNVGDTLPPDLTVSVPGYGDVQFVAGYGTVLEVGTTLGTSALQLDAGEFVTVSFLGSTATDVSFNLAGLSPGEAYPTILQTGANTYLVSSQTGTNGAGIASMTFNATVPEPSSALLGMLGGLGLLVRRRR